jgi:hypothetical protein
MTDLPPGFESAVSVRFPLDGAEWCRASRAGFLALPGVTSYHVVLRTLAVAIPLPLLFAWYRGIGPLGPILPAFVACEFTALLVLLTTEAWERLHPRLEARRMRRQVEETVLEERWVSERGLFIRSNSETTFLPWSLIAWVKETPEFLLFRGPSEAYFIPKRLLDDTELRRVRALAATERPDALRSPKNLGRLTSA